MCISVKIETDTRVFHPLPRDLAELSIRGDNNTNHQKERRVEDVMSAFVKLFSKNWRARTMPKNNC